MKKSIWYDIVGNENNIASNHPFHIHDDSQNILFPLHKNLEAVPEKVQTLFVLQGHSK